MKSGIRVFLAGIAISAVMIGIAPASQDTLRRLYMDKGRYEQLSSGAKALLQRKFGTPVSENQTPRSALREAIPATDAAVTDVRVNNLAADTTAHDTQATNTVVPGAASNIIVAFDDSGSPLGHFVGFSRSTNGGATFTDLGALPASTEGDAGDPVLAKSNTTGTIFLATLGLTTGEMIQVFRSTTDGASFSTPVNGTPGYVGTADFQDKPWITVDNFAGAGQGTVYLAWRRFAFAGGGDIRMIRSTDDGATWGPNQGVSVITATNNVQGAFPIVQNDHSVSVFYYEDTGSARSIKVKKSTDSGATFSAPTQVTTLSVTGPNGDLGLNGGFATNAFPQVATNAVNGNLYVAYNDDPAGVDRSNIFLRRSSDGGATWAAPLQVNSDSTTNDQFTPSVAVSDDGAHLMVTWNDRRNDIGNTLIERFAEIFSIDGGGNLTSIGEFRISSANFPPVVGQDSFVPATYMGDYSQSVANGSTFLSTWMDTRDSTSVHSHQPDVRFAQVPATGPGAILEFNGSTVDDSVGNNNGAIDPSDCFNLSISLKNSGTGTTTGISATLSSLTPGVTVSEPASNYPDLAAGASAANLTPFSLGTSSGFVCGANVALMLSVTTAADGTFQVPVTLHSGVVGVAQQFDNNSAIVIPDLSTIDVPVTVSGISTAVAKVKVSVHINHTNDADLDLFLVGPDNTIVELSTDNGGTSDNYGTNCSPSTTRTTFDDAAATSILAGTAPFTGTFKPEGKLDSFIGKSGSAANGVWNLRVTDDSGVDTGSIECWSLIVSPAQCTDGTGSCGCSNLLISPPTLPGGTVNVAYSQTLTASNGVPPYTFTVSSGSLPTGLTLDSSGLISGTPTASGTFNFTAHVEDSLGCVGTMSYSIVIACSTITISPASLPDATNGAAYSQQLSATGGAAPYQFSITAGTLPTGITLSSAGLISGTPTANGTFNFTVTATDASACIGTKAYSIAVSCSVITLAPATLPNGDVGTPYSQTITASGGIGPYTFAVTAGALPTGLTLASNGALTGTPTAGGTFNFTVTATDSGSCTGVMSYSIAVSCNPITLAPATLPSGQLNTPYNQTITASGGDAPYTFVVTAGTLPTGLALAADGSLTGTPTAGGSFNFTVTATDSNSCTGSLAYSIDVSSCLFCADFEDGVLDTGWSYDPAVWVESGGGLVVTANSKKASAIATPAFSGCTQCTIETTVRTAQGNVWILGWYVDKKNFVELQMNEKKNRWFLKQHANGHVKAKGKFIQTINPGVPYNVQMSYDGVQFQVTVNSVVILTVPAGAPATGTVGFQAKATTAIFDEVIVN